MITLTWGIVGALLLSVAVELAARFWIRRKGDYFVFPPGLRLRLKIDRDLFPQLERETRFEVNRDGERGGEVPRSVDRLHRILVAGGSQPEGFLLDQYTAWPGALQRLLERPEALRRLGATHVHVGSIARSGVGSEALNLILERVLPRYPRLSTIVVLVGASDVLRWLEDGAPPAPPRRARVADVFRCHPEGPFGWTPRALAAFELLRRARRRWLRPVEVHERAGKADAQARAMRARAKEIRDTMPDPSSMLDHFELHLRALLRKAQAHADRVLVVRQPWLDKVFTPEEVACMWHGGAGRVWREDVTTYYSFDVCSRLMALLDARAVRVAEELHLEHVDLMPLLEPSLEDYYDGFHATPSGSKTVARAVAAAVLRQPMTRPQLTPQRLPERAAMYAQTM